jgi:transcriptional regulator with XRE-family HTH domain
MTFGEKLQELRQATGLTQAGLAGKSGVPVGTIRDYEQGKRDPLLSNAQRLAAALSVSLDTFPSVSAESPANKPGPPRKPSPEGPGPKRRKGK